MLNGLTLKTLIMSTLSLSLFTSIAFADNQMKINTPEANAKEIRFCFSKYEPGPVVKFVSDKMIKIVYEGTKADLKVLSKTTRTSNPPWDRNIKIDVVEYKAQDLAEPFEWIVKISSYKQDKQLFITMFGEQVFFGSTAGCSSKTRVDE